MKPFPGILACFALPGTMRPPAAAPDRAGREGTACLDSGGELWGRVWRDIPAEAGAAPQSARWRVGDCELAWDGNTRALTLHRAQAARSTLYYCLDGARVWICDALPVLLSLLASHARKLDEAALADLWCLGRILPPNTAFAAFRHVRPASTLRLAAGENGWRAAENLMAWETPPVPPEREAAPPPPDEAVPAAMSFDDLTAWRVFNELPAMVKALGAPVGERGLLQTALLLGKRKSHSASLLIDETSEQANWLARRHRFAIRHARRFHRHVIRHAWRDERLPALREAALASGIHKQDAPAADNDGKLAEMLVRAERRLDISTLAGFGGCEVEFAALQPGRSGVLKPFRQPAALFPVEAPEMCNLFCQASALFFDREPLGETPLAGRLVLDPLRLDARRRAPDPTARHDLEDLLMTGLSLQYLYRFAPLLTEWTKP